jgi:hypothetical protein
VSFGIAIRVEGQLGNASPVTQVDENQAAMVAPTVDPAHQTDILANLFGTQVAAVM